MSLLLTYQNPFFFVKRHTWNHRHTKTNIFQLKNPWSFFIWSLCLLPSVPLSLSPKFTWVNEIFLDYNSSFSFLVYSPSNCDHDLFKVLKNLKWHVLFLLHIFSIFFFVTYCDLKHLIQELQMSKQKKIIFLSLPLSFLPFLFPFTLFLFFQFFPPPTEFFFCHLYSR